MNQEDILQNTKMCTQNLEAIRTQQNGMLKSLHERLATIQNDLSARKIIETEIDIIKNSSESITLALAEATMYIQFNNYLQSFEAEKQKIKSQVKRLCQENAWLRDELATTQKKLQDSEQHAAQLEVELSHLKFFKELKKYDEDLPPNQSQQQQTTSDNDEQQKKVDLGLPDEDDEQNSNNSNMTMSTYSTASSKTSSGNLKRYDSYADCKCELTNLIYRELRFLGFM